MRLRVAMSGELSIVRWRRYGKDRLYVTEPDGTALGYWDLVTDEGHPETPELAQRLASAKAAWASTLAGRVPGNVGTESREDASPPDPESAALLDTVDPGWRDLSLNRAGAEAREQALRLKEAAPVRTILARMLMVHTDERAWRIGADGEERVAEQLAKVVKRDPRWRMLHAIPVGARGSDIDHVAVGPGGVFTINAEHHPDANIWVGGDTFLVNGQRQPYIRNSRHEAARASKLLSRAARLDVEATGVVVTVNARDITVKEEPDDVVVMPRMQIARWLLRRPERLPLHVLDQIYEAARRSTTWEAPQSRSQGGSSPDVS